MSLKSLLSLLSFTLVFAPPLSAQIYSDDELAELRHSPDELQAAIEELREPADTYPIAGEDPNVRAAVEEFAETGKARVLYESTTAIHPYGEDQPTLTCAPLRLCLVELEPGEVITSAGAGDTVRWHLQQLHAGPGGNTPLVAVKPTQCDATTNLLIATDRRIYDLTLDSPPCENDDVDSTNPQATYTRRVRFYYPQDTLAAWTSREQLQALEAKRHEIGRIDIGSVSDPTALNFRYEVGKSRRAPWTPVNVMDDGRHLYIQLPASRARRNMPILYAVGPEGRELLNYRVRDDYLIADHVVEEAVLVWSDGKRPAELTLRNEGL